MSNDLIYFFIAIGLILYDFSRYFLINDIDFSFYRLNEILYKIEDSTIILAFFGFLILIAKLFNLIPFNGKNNSISSKMNPFVYSLNFIFAIILGSSLFIKIYSNFDYFLYQFQDELAIFLLINFIVFIILTVKQKNIFKFLTSSFICANIILLFSIFSFEKDCINIYFYSILAISLSYCLSAFVFATLTDKFKTYNIDEFKKINDKTKICQTFSAISLLNMASLPLLSFFNFELICFLKMFSTEYEGIILNLVPYFLIFGVFLLSSSALDYLYKILIEPIEKPSQQISFCNHQISICAILLFAIIILSIYPQCFYEQINIPIHFSLF